MHSKQRRASWFKNIHPVKLVQGINYATYYKLEFHPRKNVLLHSLLQDCHQIKEFTEKQRISIRENQREMRNFLENQGAFEFPIVSFQSSDFLHTQPRHPVECHCCHILLFCISFHCEAQFHFVMIPKI